MRSVVLILIGLFIGALGAVAAITALKQGTPYHDAVMTVLGQQMGALRGMREKNACPPQEIAHRLTLLRTIGEELEPAFLPVGDDAKFIERAKAFRDAVDAAQAAQATSCDALGAAMSGIGGTCKGCHDDFR
ncbi:MAG: cytochrome c [Lysobacteraceae bacterium]